LPEIGRAKMDDESEHASIAALGSSALAMPSLSRHIRLGAAERANVAGPPPSAPRNATESSANRYISAMPIWTQRVEITWRQNLAFFERRYSVLRELEDEGLLRRFQENDRSEISVRVGSAHQTLTFGDDGLVVAALKPESDLQVLRAAVQVVCDALDPRLSGYPELAFQSLTPLVGAYDEVRKAAAEALLGGGAVGRVGDFAVVLDGDLDEPLDDYHLEFGIVEATEVPARLSRRVGFSSSGNSFAPPPGLWQSDQLPAVALFCDSRIDASSLGPDIVDDLFATLKLGRQAAEEVESATMKRLNLAEQ
jgi:hypothetical protein